MLFYHMITKQFTILMGLSCLIVTPKQKIYKKKNKLVKFRTQTVRCQQIIGDVISEYKVANGNRWHVNKQQMILRGSVYMNRNQLKQLEFWFGVIFEIP